MPKLPPEHIEQPRKIRDVAVGEVAYAVSPALYVFDDDTAYLSAEHRVSQQLDGAFEMRVERREDGFYVRLIPGSKYEPFSASMKEPKDQYEVKGWLD